MNDGGDCWFMPTVMTLKILVGIKFGGWAPNHHCKNIGRVKFGRDRHIYNICKYNIILKDFNYRLPNHQIFHLYGTYSHM